MRQNLDIALPDMSGLTLLRRVRQEAGYEHVPIILVSALADPDVPKGFDEVDVADRLRKASVSLQEIVDCVKAALA